MPTIEIIAVDCPRVPYLPRFKTLTYKAENTLQSHRALFQAVLEEYRGVIVHLASKEFEGSEGWFYAGGLIKWDSDKILRFRTRPARDVRRLLKLMLSASPTGQILFLSDYQFGPNRKKMEQKVMTLASFWQMHDAAEIRYNALYRIRNNIRQRKSVEQSGAGYPPQGVGSPDP